MPIINGEGFENKTTMKNRIICIMCAILLFTAGCGEKRVNETGEENISDIVRTGMELISQEEIVQFPKDEGEDISGIENDAEGEPVLVDEEEKVIYHDAGECKQISFGSLHIDFVYHEVVEERRNKDFAIFFCDKDRQSGTKEPEIKVEIQRCSTDVSSYEDARSFFDKCTSYDRIEVYRGMEALTGMTALYAADGDGPTYCLAVYPEETYIVRSEGRMIQYDMLYSKDEDFLKMTYRTDEIECAGGNTVGVSEEISYPNREAQYELYVGGKETADYLLRHKIEGETGPYRNTVTVYDGEGALLQTFGWESFMDENYLEFADLNQDGYVDIKTVKDNAPAYNIHDLYTWQETEQRFEKVECEGVLADIAVRGDRIWNWGRSIPGYVVEVYRWEGNKLIMESQEYIEPDE